ncbi:uncharacterized protein I303_104417 [Kwoniella dejecticola CBS 10117]|uniref:Uncharacterized protein n=1 Tax=Kwoniella dejecticola CBS 10117 TaxID=1296121 RepID=A0A1A6A5D9_9TREE|nr:uncharacterized protein I303_04604 [Kwoniella dejecticola CBS 10117]OBR85271.1 hypothetical protein I303_04604 [Kwoniella dejecticola CBS 10117]
MSSPLPPRPPARKGPNPFLLLGLVVVSSASFFILAEKRHNDQQTSGQARRREMANPLLPSRDAESVDLPPRRKVE